MRIHCAILAVALLAGGCGNGNDGADGADTSAMGGMHGPDTAAHGVGMEQGDSMTMGGGIPGDMTQQMSAMNQKMVGMLGAVDSMYDRRFIDMMIPHHEGAVMMAEDARGKAQHAELKDLAEKIIADQRKEIDQMKRWRQQWYGDSTIQRMPDMDEMNRMMVDHLSNADSTYDDRFIDMMIPHHQGAVMMAEDAEGKATHGELRTMSRAIIDAQRTEIAQLEQWRKGWYGH